MIPTRGRAHDQRGREERAPRRSGPTSTSLPSSPASRSPRATSSPRRPPPPPSDRRRTGSPTPATQVLVGDLAPGKAATFTDPGAARPRSASPGPRRLLDRRARPRHQTRTVATWSPTDARARSSRSCRSRRPAADGAAVRRAPGARAGPPRCRRQPQRPDPLGRTSPAPEGRLTRLADFGGLGRRRADHLGGRPRGARRAGGLRPGQPPAVARSRPPRRPGEADDEQPDASPSPSPSPSDRPRRTERARSATGPNRVLDDAALDHPRAPRHCSPWGTPTRTSPRSPAADPTCCAGPSELSATQHEGARA